MTQYQEKVKQLEEEKKRLQKEHQRELEKLQQDLQKAVKDTEDQVSVHMEQDIRNLRAQLEKERSRHMVLDSFLFTYFHSI